MIHLTQRKVISLGLWWLTRVQILVLLSPYGHGGSPTVTLRHEAHGDSQRWISQYVKADPKTLVRKVAFPKKKNSLLAKKPINR